MHYNNWKIFKCICTFLVRSKNTASIFLEMFFFMKHFTTFSCTPHLDTKTSISLNPGSGATIQSLRSSKGQEAWSAYHDTLTWQSWQIVATDLFELKGVDYLIVIDYFSRYVEVAAMQKTTKSSELIRALKSVFARHGIPEQVRSDNGSQYRCMTFADCRPQTADPIDKKNSINREVIINNISRVR